MKTPQCLKLAAIFMYLFAVTTAFQNIEVIIVYYTGHYGYLS